jgi:hypothetical protein
MKKFITGCFILLILYVVAYDLKVGTLPQTQQVNAQLNSMEESILFESYTVAPGDTVISIVEKMNDHTTFSIPVMVKDFKALNPGVNPESIQIDKSYKFPLYKKAQR